MVFLASSRIKAAKDQSLLGDSILLISPIASFSIVTFSQLLVTAILIPSASAHASVSSAFNTPQEFGHVHRPSNHTLY
ncbi:hypothetical protein V6N12_073901 [Hibiscus sabdariffa]|uniref:Uncharacterized protein n=1 Tax=Hibiscus sabdariffa TaxID=183260 RepID=A0ABR2AWC3_9ROSI